MIYYSGQRNMPVHTALKPHPGKGIQLSLYGGAQAPSCMCVLSSLSSCLQLMAEVIKKIGPIQLARLAYGSLCKEQGPCHPQPQGPVES